MDILLRRVGYKLYGNAIHTAIMQNDKIQSKVEVDMIFADFKIEF